MAAAAEHVLQRHRLSVDDYYRMADAGILLPTDRVELIEGEIIDMPPIGSRHSGIVTRLTRFVHEGFGHQAVIQVQSPVRLSSRSEPEPDITVLRPRDDTYTQSHPTAADVLLLVEVGESSLAYDSDVKLPLYARHGVPEVWIVDLNAKRLTCHTLPLLAEGRYRLTVEADVEQSVSPSQLPGVALDLSQLFAHL